MKKSTLKGLLMFLSISLCSISAEAVIVHGSAMGTGLPLYNQYNAGTLDPLTIKAATFDYKVVTIGSKSWAWTRLNGATIGGADWASQLRYWGGATFGNVTENNLLYRAAANAQTYGSTTKTIPNPLQLSFFQAIDPGGFCETARINYDKTVKNSADPEDVTVPEITSATTSSIEEVTATLSFEGSDNSGNLFYHITGDGIEEISFLPTITLSGLTPTTSYSFTVTPIDFSGNEGTPANVSFTTGGLVQVTYGIANDIRFKFKSTGTQLEYYYEFTDTSKRFFDAFLKILPAGDTEFEIKPTVSPDGTYAYGVTSDSRIANKVLTLNCGYCPLDEGWVMTNNIITSGDLSGNPIKHQMGGALYATQIESTNPVLNSVSLVDISSGYVTLNIDGSDNSGYIFYEITGAKESVKSFRTGNYYLTAIEPGKNYTLNVVAKDFSGNYTSSQQVQVKTMQARSNIKDSTSTNYNTLVLPAVPGGELTTIIQQSGNNLTIGCTTQSLLIYPSNRNKKFNNPTIEINETKYPLTITNDSLTATTTFTGTIGETSIVAGTALQVKWSVFWGSAGPGGIPQGGNFFTGAFTYVVGDNGQDDVEGPSNPNLTLTTNQLTWPASVDLLSGVKWYLVAETGQTPQKIFDLGDASFSYTMTDPESIVTVTAVDFVGNSSASTLNDVGTSQKELTSKEMQVYPNPTTDWINFSGDVSEASLFSLQGKRILSVSNTRSMNVSALSEGLYIIRLTDISGNHKATKIKIR